jgi:hypothetical protein
VGTNSGCFGRVLRGAGGRRTWAGVALFTALAVLSSSQSPTPTGWLSGKLTDLYSRPVGEATLVLRNAATGAEATARTGRDGSYRFSGLAPGEYTLEAVSQHLGHGQIAGIYVGAGHESRMQAALRLDRDPEPLRPPMQTSAGTAPRPGQAPEPGTTRVFIPPVSAASKPAVLIPPLEAGLSQQPIEVLRLRAVPALTRQPGEAVPSEALAKVPNSHRQIQSPSATNWFLARPVLHEIECAFRQEQFRRRFPA